MKNRFRWLIKKAILVYNVLFNRKRHSSLSVLKNASIAYVIGGGIGDAVMAYPAIHFLKKKFPDAHITVFVPIGLYPLLSAVFCRYSLSPMNLLFIHLLKQFFIRRGFFLSFTNTTAVFSITSEILSYFSSKYSCGFSYPEENSMQRLFTRSKKIDEETHFSEQNIRLISESLHIPYDKSDVFLRSNPDREIDAVNAPILIHPGSKKGYDNKRWPVENYTELIQRLIKKGNNIIILLGPDDTALEPHFHNSESIRKYVNPAIPELIHIFKEALLFIGNDSGPAHLAAFFGIPGITLYGPESPHRSAPCGKTSISIYNDTDCSPCHFSQNACYDNRCMKSITVDQVWKEAKKHLHHG